MSLLLVLAVLSGAAPAPVRAWSTFPGANGKLAFTSDRLGTIGIFTMNPDGSDQQLVRNDGHGDFFGAWSPDGRTFAFFEVVPPVGAAQDLRGLYVANADGSHVRRLTYTCVQSPEWSPDGRKIAFDGCFDDFNVYVVDVGTAQLTTIPNRGEDPPWPDPNWSPNGHKLAFTIRDGIEVVDADGSHRTVLRTDPLDPLFPTWSPDGRKIAFSGFAAGDKIFVIDADGSNMRQLSGQNALLFRWSPDGREIAFDGQVPPCSGPCYAVFVINADGSDLTRLTDTDAGDPFWSPDGRTIAFTRPDGTYTMNADGSDQTKVDGTGPGDEIEGWQAVPLADLSVGVARRVVFSDKGRRRLVYTITAHDGGPSNIMNVTITDRLPARATLISARANEGGCHRSMDGVTCSLGLQLTGTSWTARLVVEATGTKGPIRNTVRVRSSTPDPNPANNAATVTSSLDEVRA